MVNINSKTQARKRVREAQIKANEARIERERQNVDDAASFLVELGRLAAVDEWQQNRILEVRAEGERRRHEHRQAGAAAVARMQERGETPAAIVELAGVKVGQVRAVLMAANARPSARPDALGATDGAADGTDAAPSNGAAAPPVGVDVGLAAQPDPRSAVDGAAGGAANGVGEVG
jgi:hypothetical protein